MLVDILKNRAQQTDGFFLSGITKKPHTIEETFVKPCAVDMVKLLLGETSAKKIQQKCKKPLSNDTIKRRILLMSTDVKQQVIANVLSKSLLSVRGMKGCVSSGEYCLRQGSFGFLSQNEGVL